MQNQPTQHKQSPDIETGQRKCESYYLGLLILYEKTISYVFPQLVQFLSNLHLHAKLGTGMSIMSLG